MGILLRAGGLVAIALSMLAGAALDHALKATAPHPLTVLEFVLAALSFAFATAGAALLIVGPKLFEPQEVSAGWQRRADHRPRASLRRRRP